MVRNHAYYVHEVTMSSLEKRPSVQCDMQCGIFFLKWFEVHIDSGWELHIFRGPLRSLLLSMNCLCVKISNRKTDCTKVFLCCGHMRILATVLRSREQANVGNQINDEPPHTMKKGQITHRVICLARVGNHNAGSNCSRSQGEPLRKPRVSSQIWALWKTWLKYCNLSTIKCAPQLPPNNSQRI